MKLDADQGLFAAMLSFAVGDTVSRRLVAGVRLG
ncbi:hypothetical protein X748_06710 [Mesorhizobium sp. LNJC386A00]|nr:hypothetical protein X752_18720 [Mesorhizobium sp. LNJC398B00]ESY37721.1 hypothetical protein X748_06710 [Mesorhizobium sp. LNJC386A00]